MPLLIGIGQRLRLAERRIAEGKRNVIAEHHLLILRRKGPDSASAISPGAHAILQENNKTCHDGRSSC